MDRRVTLKQVALHAGVSYQTVSKVLNNKANVSKETEARIWEAVRTLGYHPNQIARSLRTQRSWLIGYSWAPAPPDQANPILDQFLQSMLRAAESEGYHLLCFPHHFDEKQIDPYQRLIGTNRVDGFVVSGVEFDDPRIEFLLERQFPFVAFGRSNPQKEFPFVDLDGGAGMRMVVRHLIEQGHQQIAAMAWPEDSRVGQNRMEGYLAALEEAGIEPRPDWIMQGEGNYRFGWETSARLLSLEPGERPTAIVAFNDAMAVGAMNAAQALGLKVGNDVAITGFDDVPMAQYLSPSLTSVRQPIWEIGQRVIGMMVNLLEGAPLDRSQVLFQPELVVRESSTGEVPEEIHTWSPFI